MFNFLKRKPKASDDTKLFFACYQAEQRPPIKLRQGNGKTQSEKFRERYQGVDPFNRTTTPSQSPKQTKGKLNSTKKRRTETTLRSFADLDVFCC